MGYSVHLDMIKGKYFRKSWQSQALWRYSFFISTCPALSRLWRDETPGPLNFFGRSEFHWVSPGADQTIPYLLITIYTSKNGTSNKKSPLLTSYGWGATGFFVFLPAHRHWMLYWFYPSTGL